MFNLHSRKYGSGPPLVILHGLFGSSDNWHSLANRWGEFFTVYTLDLRNHGASPHEIEMNYPVMAEDVRSFLMDQRLDQVSIVGHSMGGKVGMELATTYPDQVASLIVLDIGVGRTEGKHDHILSALRSIQPDEYAARSDIEEALRPIISNPDIRQFLLKNILRRVDGSFAWKFNRDVLIDSYDTLTSSLELKDVFMGATLFLRGSESDYLEEGVDPEILQYFPMSQLRTIEGAGHWLHADQPEQIYACVKDFFHDLS